jgi:pyruvyltransferase
MEELNLRYWHTKRGFGNFGDELSPFVVSQLLNPCYKLTHNKPGVKKNLVAVGSYLASANTNDYIWGTGVRTNHEAPHKYANLNVASVRGPLTRNFLMKKGIEVPEIYGDPALLVPRYFKPSILPELYDKIGIVPHFTNYEKVKAKCTGKHNIALINPLDKWTNVVSQIVSCDRIVSSSLHGIILADAYGKPNLWYNEIPIEEGNYKFLDYFATQDREANYLTKFSDIELSTEFHRLGSKVDLDKLASAFPFR